MTAHSQTSAVGTRPQSHVPSCTPSHIFHGYCIVSSADIGFQQPQPPLFPAVWFVVNAVSWEKGTVAHNLFRQRILTESQGNL